MKNRKISIFQNLVFLRPNCLGHFCKFSNTVNQEKNPVKKKINEIHLEAYIKKGVAEKEEEEETFLISYHDNFPAYFPSFQSSLESLSFLCYF